MSVQFSQAPYNGSPFVNEYGDEMDGQDFDDDYQQDGM